MDYAPRRPCAAVAALSSFGARDVVEVNVTFPHQPTIPLALCHLARVLGNLPTDLRSQDPCPLLSSRAGAETPQGVPAGQWGQPRADLCHPPRWPNVLAARRTAMVYWA